MGLSARTRLGLLLALTAVVASTACATSRAYRRGQQEAKKGNWDLAVAQLMKANEGDPENIGYKIALENAKMQASRFHYDEGLKHLAADELDQALEELEIATNYDRGNKAATDERSAVAERIRQREEEKRRLSDFSELKRRARAARIPVPVLAPRSPVPITLNFPDQSLEKIFDALSKISGVNILLDEGFRDKRVTVKLSGVTFQEALDQITLANRQFYKVLDQNTLIVVPESPAKRRSYDDQLVQTFYIENADVTETLALVKAITGVTKSVANKALGAITLMGTPDELAVAAKIIESNDKALGEVVVEVEVLEVNRTNLRRYGIELSAYEGAITLAPTGADGEVNADTGLTSVRAHLLSSLNLSDFIVSIPSTLLARFLQTESTFKLLAAPRLRAAEGKQTSLRIGTEVPVPITTFTAAGVGGAGFAQPATSFQYRNVGVSLDLTPSVSASGEITLEITAEVSVLGEDRNVSGGANPLIVPTFLTRNITGVLRLRDGETTLIGGLLQSREAKVLTGLLGMQSVPVLNKLFVSTRNQEEEQEILISITPRLVRAPRITESDLDSLYAGTKEGIRVPSVRPLFGPEEEVSEEPVEPGAAEGAPAPTAETTDQEPNEEPAPDLAAQAPPEREARLPRPVTARLSPGELTLELGETGALSIVALGVVDLVGVELALSYDASLIQADEVSPGSLLTLDGVAVGAERGLEAGRVRARFMRPSPTAGSGAVATVQLRAVGPGEGVVMIESLTLILSSDASVGVALPGPAPVKVEP